MRLDPSPIPKGKHTANSNRAYLSPDTTVSISGHILFIRSNPSGSAVLRTCLGNVLTEPSPVEGSAFL